MCGVGTSEHFKKPSMHWWALLGGKRHQICKHKGTIQELLESMAKVNRRSTACKHTAIKCKINSTLARVMLPVMGNDIPTPIPRDIEGETRRTQLYGALSLTKHDSFQKLMGNDCVVVVFILQSG